MARDTREPRVETAGEEETYTALRQEWGGDVRDLTAAIGIAGNIDQLKADLAAAKVELWDNRVHHKKPTTSLLPIVRQAYEDRRKGPKVRSWGHRAGGSVVVFWVAGLAEYWDVAEVHVHIYNSDTSYAAGEFEDPVAANIRFPYRDLTHGTPIDDDDPIVALVRGHGKYDPGRWDKAQGPLADF